MKRDTLLGRLEAWVQEETGAQLRLLELLRRQRAALTARDHAVVEESALAIEAALRERGARERSRDDLLAAFARHFQVDAADLSVVSIAARLGEHGSRLGRLRDRLRDLALEVQREGRVVMVLARQNRAFLREVIECVVGAGAAGGDDERARILDARA